MGLVRLPLIAICLLSLPVYAQYSGGSGTADDPYQIATAADLVQLANSESDWDKHFALFADIDLSRFSWSGPLVREFSGTLDGQGHRIRNLVVNASHHLGLVGTLQPDAEIRHVGVADARIVGTSSHIGILVGDNRGTISGSHTAGTVRGDGAVGGLVGGNGGNIINCHSSASVTGEVHTGGLVGVNRDGGSLRGTYCTGRVWGGGRTGGLAGDNHGIILSSYSTSQVSGQLYVGGLVGNNYEAIVFGSYSTGAVSGLVAVGGLVGGNREGASVIGSYSTGAVDGGSGTGGLVGDNLSSHVVNSYSTGTVRGSSNVGGLVGKNIDGGIVVHSYWDKSAAGHAQSAGGVGLTAAEMRDAKTYLDAGWDFAGEAANGLHETWQMATQDGPPVLSVFNGYQPPALVGTGTPESPYLVSSGQELGAIVHYRLDACYRLDGSVDLSGVTWPTSVIPEFSGLLDGNNLSIRNLTITDSHDGPPDPAGEAHIPTTQGYMGLVGTLKGTGQIRGLKLLNADVVGAGENVGSVAGSNEGLLTNVFCSGTVEGRDCVGGLVGIICERANVLSSSSASTVQGDWAAGGLVGLSLHAHATIAGCGSTGAVNGDRDVGGLVGFNQGSIIDSYSTSVVRADQHAGGLAGSNAGSLSDSHSSGAVSGRIWAGGLVGHNQGSAGIFSSYSSSAADGDEDVAGLVGRNTGSVGACYSTGVVVGREKVGGLVGSNSGNVSVSYSTGEVAGQARVGGLVGFTDDGAVWSSFWALESSGQLSSDGGVGLSVLEMRDPLAYLSAGWDFVDEVANGLHETWQMPAQAGPPVLSVFDGYRPPTLAGAGTPESPYLISNGRELAAIAHHRPGGCYELTEEIDVTGISWSISVIPQFLGSLDGKGLSVHGLTVTGAGDLGLLGILRSGAELRHLRVVDANVVGSGNRVGALVGYSRGMVTRAFCSGRVAGTKYVGGLAGHVLHGDVANSRCVATVTGSDYVGGLLGCNFEGSVTYSCSSGRVDGEQDVGGLVGHNRSLFREGAVSNCYSHATVAGDSTVGGLVGHNESEIIASSYATGSVTGSEEVGGLVGRTMGGDGSGQAGCFWDVETSGVPTSDGGIGKTTAEMQTASTFLEAGWDLVGEAENGTDDIWWIDEGHDYPRLWWERGDESPLQSK